MLRTLKSLFAALALLVVPAAVRAEEPTKSYPDCGHEATDAEVQAAKGAFQAGNASFNEADYARAIDYWEDAYRRDCTANPLLLNLARAYELAGRKRQAVVALETFLAREPNSGEKDQINRRVEVLKKKIAEEDATAAAAASANNTAAATPVTPPPTGPTPPPVVEASSHHSPWPWVVIGVGGAVAIVGTIGMLDNNKKINDADAACNGMRTQCSDSAAANKGNDARKALTRSEIVTGVGGAAIVGGIVWLVIDRRHADQQTGSLRRPRVDPLLGSQVAGLSFSGAF